MVEKNSDLVGLYFKRLVSDVRKEYVIANEARAKKLDPVDKVEIPLAMSLAEKSVGLISTIYPQLGEAVTKRILELEEEYGQLDPAVSFKIAEEVAKERFCKFESLIQAIDAGIRVGFAYTTLGVVASPIEGYTGLKLGRTREGKEYFIAYFSGPIRSAGTTASCVVLMIIDYLREIFGFARYDPDENEVKRYVTENTDYHERVTNLQYFPTEEEMAFLASNIPIQIDGDPTEKKEVSNFKDLGRVETNFIRGGMCLCFSEGLAQKAQKGYRLYKSCKDRGLNMTGFDWIPDYLEIHKKRQSGSKESGTEATYIKDLVAGRPVYGHPSKSGGFRFRYGRSRVAGFSSVSVHPATMGISNDFLSSGTQLKIEKPTKGCIITSCNEIDGPVVKLKKGSVKRVESLEEARKLYKEVEEIIYLGDILFPLGDVMNRNSELLKPGYVEEWWALELKKKLEVTGEDFNVVCRDVKNLLIEEAVNISEKYSIPLHPKHIFYWSQIKKEDFFWLMDWMRNGVWRFSSNEGKLVLPYSKFVQEKFSEGKRALELLAVSHEVVLDNVVISEEAKSLLVNLGIKNLENGVCLKEFIDKIILENKFKNEVLEIVNDLCGITIKDKAGTWIGSRMGRPEKAKLRKLTGSPSVLFPVGEEGGRFRSVQEAARVGSVKSDFPYYLCDCGNETIYSLCEKCGKETRRMYWCFECKKFSEKKCLEHEKSQTYSRRKIDVNYFFEKAISSLGYDKLEVPVLIKGIRGTSSENHDFENLAKGILRSKYNLCVNKDGTVRYDGTEIMITQFKPAEVGTSVLKLKELGYEKDIFGKELKEDNQILELMPHDILLPSCPVTQDERADEVFFNIAKFVDDELEKFYKIPKFYNLKNKEDLAGHLVVCMAPHNCAGVIGRIIGTCKLQGIVASPYMHAAMRRDCDGDEAAVMMLLDVLINFSRKFLPAHRGGTQDAPLVLNAHIRAGEVDDQILDFEVCSSYPLEMYELAEKGRHSSEVSIETVKKRLKEGKCPFTNIGFTHNSKNFNDTVLNSAYKILPTMKDKVEQQMELVSKIRAVDTDDVARLIIERHFIRDIRGNLRKFSHQQFRCVACNEKFRRPPLSGVCTKCQGKIIFTISEGSIKKYLDPAINLAETFAISDYTKQSLNLAKMYIESIFGKDKDKQVDLKSWF